MTQKRRYSRLNQAISDINALIVNILNLFNGTGITFTFVVAEIIPSAFRKVCSKLAVLINDFVPKRRNGAFTFVLHLAPRKSF